MDNLDRKDISPTSDAVMLNVIKKVFYDRKQFNKGVLLFFIYNRYYLNGVADLIVDNKLRITTWFAYYDDNAL